MNALRPRWLPGALVVLAAAGSAVLARARGGEHWAFVTPRRPALPEVRDTSWARDPLDRFVLARMEEAGLAPAPEADRATWLRRATFDLTGLPPTLAELDAFLADAGPDAYERAADRLLASPRYGERMAADWLDVARYADTYGYQADRYREVWPWRDWVIRAFDENLPYDDFVTWQLAGDLLPGATRDQRLATTFERLHRQTNEGGSVEEEYRLEYVSDRVDTLGTAFLGLTLGCARCHDHKFDPVTQREYYELSAFFANIDESGLYSHFTDAVPTPALSLSTPEDEARLAELEAEIARAEDAIEGLPEARAAAFDAWRADPARTAQLRGCTGSFPLDEIAVAENPDGDAPGPGRLANLADPEHPGQVADDPSIVAGRPGTAGGALSLSGDDNATFPGVGELTRSDPFTLALWMQVPDRKERAVVLHRSRAWTDAGSQGYQLLIEDGRLSAALIHFWPGDAICIQATEELATGRWVHVALTYDGSSRAGGLALYVDGRRAPVDTVRDHLTRGITGGGPLVLTLGQRFRDRGLKGGQVDDLRVFDRELGPLEVRQLADGRALDEAVASAPELSSADELEELRAYYLLQVDPVVDEARAELRRLRHERAELLDRIPAIMTMAELSEPRPTFVLKRGSYLTPGERVGAGTPAFLPAFPAGAPRDRLGLARWLTAPDHPLTARVEVNRLWQALFGRGIVETSEDLGTQGAPPSHPGLLDYLGREFVDGGWDVKALLRRIVLSATYRQSSRASDEARALDPEGRLLARFPSRRLSAEMIRDAALAASGLLVDRVGGPSVRPYQPPGLWEEKSGTPYDQQHGEALYRRSLYTVWKRTSPPPDMMLFDSAKRDVCVARRQRTSTPLQALVLMNDPQYVEAARVLAERMLREAPAEPRGRIAFAFRVLTSRPPREPELAVLSRLYDEQSAWYAGHPDEAAALLTVGEATADPSLAPAELATCAVVASTIFSSDATITLR